jgi:hypothetical protein
LHELNKFVNIHVRKNDDELNFVTLENDQWRENKDEAVLSIYLGHAEKYKTDPQKMVNGVKYFLGEMGINISKQEPDDEGNVVLHVHGLDKFNQHGKYDNLKNKWMQRALEGGTAVDVRETGVETEPGVFRLTEFIPEVTYVDSETESFIQSIGKDLESGEILASTGTEFYGHEDYECIYLH